MTAQIVSPKQIGGGGVSRPDSQSSLESREGMGPKGRERRGGEEQISRGER